MLVTRYFKILLVIIIWQVGNVGRETLLYFSIFYCPPSAIKVARFCRQRTHVDVNDRHSRISFTCKLSRPTRIIRLRRKSSSVHEIVGFSSSKTRICKFFVLRIFRWHFFSPNGQTSPSICDHGRNCLHIYPADTVPAA